MSLVLNIDTLYRIYYKYNNQFAHILNKMVSPLIIVSINSLKSTRSLDALSVAEGRELGAGPAASRRGCAGAGVAAVVADGLELVGLGVGGEPLLDGEELLRAPLVRAHDGDLDVVAVSPVVRPRDVGGHTHPARRPRHAGPTAAEDVEVGALEVGVALPHEPAPGAQVRDPHAVAVRRGNSSVMLEFVR